MLTNEKKIGNYLTSRDMRKNLQMEPIERETMIALIQELHRIKKYCIETFFLACSIADRFLSKLGERQLHAPNLVCLATVSLLLAAKLLEHKRPCFDMMIKILP